MKRLVLNFIYFHYLNLPFFLLMVNRKQVQDCLSELKVVVMIWTEDLKLLTFHFCIFYGLLIINIFF